MHLISCFNPQYIRNPYTGVESFVPCGKCEACLSKHSSSWVERLEQECRCHKYSIFFTLTYSQDSVPTMYKQSDCFVDESTGLCIPFNPENYDSFSDKLFYLDKSHIQKFMKRLRKNLVLFLHKNNKTSYYDKIRYYICGEYGPTTLRPHYHGILWFDKELTSSEIGNLLHSAWSFRQDGKSRQMYGYLSWEFVESTACSYVAKYVNSFAHLPKVLQDKSIRPFALFSKRPAIGTLVFDSEIIKQYFYSSSPTVSVFDSRLGQNVSVPMWRTFKDRLYPKISRFTEFNTTARKLLYSVSKFYASEDFAEFEKQIPYIRKTCPVFEEWLTKCSCLDRVDGEDVLSDFGRRCVNRLYRISKRVDAQARVFGMTISRYVDFIEQFYYRLDMLKLKEYFTFQEDFAKNYPNDLPYLLSLDKEYFYNALLDKSGQYEKLLLNYNVPLEIINADEKTKVSYLYQVSSELHQDSAHYVSLIRKIYDKSCKTKKKNDYLVLHPESQLSLF